MPAGSATVDDILRCARRLIVVGGYNGFSYADIAEAVGIRKASIHHHFPTKAILVRSLLQRYREEFRAGIAAIDQHHATPTERLRAYLGYWEGCIGDPGTAFCICALLSTEIPLLPSEVVTELTEHFRALSDWLAVVLESGADRGDFVLRSSSRAEAETVMATVHGAMLSVRAYGDPRIFGDISAAVIARLTDRD